MAFKFIGLFPRVLLKFSCPDLTVCLPRWELYLVQMGSWFLCLPQQGSWTLPLPEVLWVKMSLSRQNITTEVHSALPCPEHTFCECSCRNPSSSNQHTPGSHCTWSHQLSLPACRCQPGKTPSSPSNMFTSQQTSVFI